MSNKRKILLYITIGIIVSCFVWTFYSIINHSDIPQKQRTEKTIYQELDAVKTSTVNDNSDNNLDNQTNSYVSAIEKFYNELIESNKVTANDIGDLHTFSKTIRNSGIKELSKLHQLLRSKGFSESEIGNVDAFFTKVENLRVNSNSTVSTEKTDNNYLRDSYHSDPVYVESRYKGNQLKNGSSPFDTCFGKGIYNGNATLTIKNGANSDAIVCLYSIHSNRTIRNEYVRKNTSFTMDNIAQGNYKIRVFYGNNWNPNLENTCGTKGFFESDVSFSEFDRTEYFEDSDEGYTVATVTLYTVSGGNASTSKISQSSFFSN